MGCAAVIESSFGDRRCARDATVRLGAVPLCWQHAEGVRHDLRQDRVLVELHKEIKRLERQCGSVYFARRPDDPSRIKIGYTTCVPRRMATLQLDLIAAIPGGLADESGYHRRFADLRIEGEWFHAEPILTGYIGTLPDA